MTSGAHLVVRALEDEGIRLAFGIPGTHNIELYDALADSATVRPVLVTDEQSASFMADAAWRASGVMACVNIVPGAGLTHAMSGIAEAFMDCIPMLVLGCGIRRDTEMRFQLHDVNQQAIAAPVTKGTFRPSSAAEIYGTIRRACAMAREGRPGPVFVEIPANLYLLGSGEAQVEDRRPRLSDDIPLDLVDRAAEILKRSKRPLLYVGLGAMHADVVALAERLESPVATTFQGKGVFPETHPLALWPGYGASAPPFARKIASECDATLAIGCRFGEVGTGSYGAPPPEPLIHVDIDPEAAGHNYHAQVAIAGDAAAFVRALLERLPNRSRDASLRDAIRRGRAEAFREIEEASEKGVSPGALIRTLQTRFGPETIFTTDSGNGTFIAVESLVLDKPGKLLAPVDYSCMGYAVPAAIGAKLARPEAPVVALAGDGAFLMTGLELLTAANQDAPVMVFVLHDRELAQIAQFQSTAFGRKPQSVLPDFDLQGIARGVGIGYTRMENDGQIGAVLDRIDRARPVLVDVAIDYSRKTFFTRGVVKTNLLRLPWKDRLRFIGRAGVRSLVFSFSRGGRETKN
ncbi:MAG TPA: thiamine pyrophosphate-binding protein [Thermoanaerobaculia bacterium]|nr:thiamine pyrophosphate-binding protein [Thermoanaerobaculia bacterium]